FTRLPASATRRARTSSGSVEARMSNRSSTAVATLLTFWPPGPDARTNRSSSSDSGIEIAGVTVSTRRSLPHGRALPHAPVLDDDLDLGERGDVEERIAAHHDDVRDLARLDRAEDVALAEELGVDPRRRGDRALRAHAGVDVCLDLAPEGLRVEV